MSFKYSVPPWNTKSLNSFQNIDKASGSTYMINDQCVVYPTFLPVQWRRTALFEIQTCHWAQFFFPDSQSNLTANPKQDPEKLQALHAIIHSLAQNIL